MSAPAFLTVIGLEVHVQLLTQSKLFCGCRTTFGAPPNTQVCPVCLGLPGALPVLNRRAVALSLRTGAALDCRIARRSKWDRKNYYYPDLPKGYQISQFDLPLCQEGSLAIVSPDSGETRAIRIRRAHLEEDAGKSMHDEQAGQAESRVDLNRTGTPLLEIVTEPDLRSAAEAKVFLTELKLLLTYLKVSDCNMQEGSLRVDANINLHIPTAAGMVATPIVEVKNLNSFRMVERALIHEADRQIALFRETGQRLGDVPKQTRGWNDEAGLSRPQRQKEESADYRYFPDPDLVPVEISPEEEEEVRQAVGERPAALRARLAAQFQLSAYDADVLVNQGPELAAYYEEVATKVGDGKLASNWLQQDVLRTLKESGGTIEDYPVRASTLADLLKKVQAKELATAQAREILAALKESGQSLDEVIRTKGFGQVDETALIELCRQIVAANPRIAADVQQGKPQAAGALVGQAKKKNPQVNPGRVLEICLQLIRNELS